MTGSTEYTLALSDAEIARYGAMARSALDDERHLWKRAGIVEGAVVADVGCGPGAVSVILAELVGASGHVWGVDRDPGALATARTSAEQSGVTNVTFRQGDAHDTGLELSGTDAVMLRHVLAHNGGREQAIVDHLASLVCPGGCVYLVDTEGTGVRMRPLHPDLSDLTQRYLEFHARKGNDLSIGLRLGELIAAAGLELLEFRGQYQIMELQPGFSPPPWAARDAMMAAGVADTSDIERWRAALQRVGRASPRYTTFLPQFTAIGRRPG